MKTYMYEPIQIKPKIQPQEKMKTTIRTIWKSLLVVFLGMLLVGQAHGQIYVVNQGSGAVGEYHLDGIPINTSLITVSIGPNEPTGIALSGNTLYVIGGQSGTNSTVGTYNATTGAVINPSLVTQSQLPESVAISGNNLYVVSAGGSGQGTGFVGVYNATTGAPISVPLLSGLVYPLGVALSGNHLYLPQELFGTFGEINVYNATTGAPLASPLVSGLLNSPAGLAISGNMLFEANFYGGNIGKYDATTGAVINASFISGLSNPTQLAVLGNYLFVTNYGNGTIGEYDATTGATINASLISGLSQPWGIAVRHRRNKKAF
jgi:WD40 repeat protein